MKEFFKIGEISKLYHIGTDSLRYYEELGILTPKRGPNQYRLYTLNDLWKLNVIRDLRSLDFSMERIKEYMDHRSIQSTEELLAEELLVIKNKIRELRELEENVKNRLHTIQSCENNIPSETLKKNIFRKDIAIEFVPAIKRMKKWICHHLFNNDDRQISISLVIIELAL